MDNHYSQVNWIINNEVNFVHTCTKKGKLLHQKENLKPFDKKRGAREHFNPVR